MTGYLRASLLAVSLLGLSQACAPERTACGLAEEGCGRPPEDGGIGFDGGPSAVDAGTHIDPNDVLTLDPSTIETVQGWMRCVQLRVTHADGTSELLVPAEVNVNLGGPGAAHVIVGEPDDCAPNERTRFAFIGTTAGEAPLTVRVGPISFPARVNVITAQVRAVPIVATRLTTSVGRATSIPYPFYIRAYDSSGQRLRIGQPVPRWTTMSIVDPTIATLEQLSNGQYAATGRSVGATDLSGMYEGPASAFEGAYIGLDVVESGTLEYVFLRLYEPGTLTDIAPAERNVCFDAQLFGHFTTNDGYFQARIDESVVWSSEGLADQGAQRFCVDSAGTMTIEGCFMGMCARRSQYIPAVAIAGLRIELLAAEPFRPTEESPFVVCPPVAVHADFVDGTSSNITSAAGIRFEMTVPGKSAENPARWSPILDASLAPTFDANGYACLRSPGSRPIGSTVTVSFMASIAPAAFVQTSFDVIFP